VEKIADLLGEQLAVEPAPGDETVRLRERQQKFERWAGIAGMTIFGVIILATILIVFQQMILKGGGVALAGLLIILLMIGAGLMGGLQTYSKLLKEKLAKPRLPAPRDSRPAETTGQLGPYREPVASITDRTTALLAEPDSTDE